MAGLTDTLAYDGLNRLTQVVTSNPGLPLSLTKTVTYDSIGNITNKSDVGDYTYDPARIHAVASIAPGATGTVTASYTYDGNGNLLTGNGRTVTWTSFDMVDQVTQGANSLTFTYDSERNRLKQVSSDGSVKYYLNDPISGIMAEKIVGASLSVTWNDYIMVGAEMVALKVSGAATQTRYFHKDHLGSITALTNEAGTIAELNSFDAWGQRRNPMGPDDPLFPGLSITSQITRGYTGHEQLDQVGLIHMNGRIYDPIIGKMMSADPFIQNPYDGQSYNRYAYVQNNPLSLTDPTGFFIETAFDVASLAAGIASLADNLATGNYGAAVVDAIGVVADAAATLAPGIPGGVSLGIKVVREGVEEVAEQGAKKAIKETAETAAEQAAKKTDDAGISAAEQAKQSTKTSGSTPNLDKKKQYGSYTNTHESGISYAGKGDEERAAISAADKTKAYNDPLKRTDWSSAATERDAFKDESRRLDALGGPQSKNNYNKIESPGKRYREQDGEL